MQRVLLNQNWMMQQAGSDKRYPCSIPCSMYDTLQKCGEIEDPFYRENESAALPLSESDYLFETTFPRPSFFPGAHVVLCFDGIDTIADISLNGKALFSADNMHRRWRIEVTDLLEDQNTLTVLIHSPLRYIAEKQAEHPLWGVDSTVAGFPHIRKAHYMFGWDWGPKLPDLGIWRDVYLEAWADGRIRNVQYLQEHSDDAANLTVCPDFEQESEGLEWIFALYDPNGDMIFKTEPMPVSRSSLVVRIGRPQLWWAHGFGKPDLYTGVVLLTDARGNAVDSRTEKIGLRTLTIRQEPDQWGESFCINLNGKDIFAMGANWIPTDNLLPRCTAEKTRQLLKSCIDANFNVIRVWGGGFYPSDAFYDFCDENGLIVWEDFMFACANYRLTDDFWASVEAEMRDNILRLRNHASLGLWCGNNEIETALETWGLPDDPVVKADYIEQFEHRMPAVVQELDPQRFYWRSSPSAYGGCKDTDSNAAGDMHYWEIWHSFKPFEAFRELYYRFCSEYGFESVPSVRTLLPVCDPEQGDLNLMSPVMEAHHKCAQGSQKIMYYLAQMVRYPESFAQLSYASQLVQAECIRSNVEHMRRHRGRCMGSVYWQLNDSNPAISWSSVDYAGRWKGVHYYARRFHAPVLLTAGAFGDPEFNVSNETLESISGTIHWMIRNNRSEILREGRIPVDVPALSAQNYPRPEGLEEFYTPENRRRYYLSYELEADHVILSAGTSLLTVPKQFDFCEPHISFELRKLPSHYIVTITSDVFVQAAMLECGDHDVQFSDNWIDLHGGVPVTVTIPKQQDLTLEILRRELRVVSQMTPAE